MIDFSEIGDFERFEDLCQEILLAKGLQVRRFGRGPGQLGKDIIVQESYVGTLSGKTVKKWLVEVKFTTGNRSLSESDISNVLDRVNSQGGNGYFLFTNARLSVNLEKTLNGLGKRNDQLDILIWIKNSIEKELLDNLVIFKKFFPVSYNKWIKQNRLFFLNQVKLCKSPLTCTVASLHLIKGLLDKPGKRQIVKEKISKVTKLVRSLIDEMDEFLVKVDVD